MPKRKKGTEEPGAVFFNALVNEQENSHQSDDESINSRDDNLSDGESIFSTKTVDSAEICDIYGNPIGRPTEEEPSEGAYHDSETAPANGVPPAISVPANPEARNDDEGDEVQDPTIPSGRSIAHDIIEKKKAVYVSTDIEIGGDIAGIIQLSVEVVRMDLAPPAHNPTSTVKDVATNVRRGPTFDRYIKPDCKAEYWDDKLTEIHGLHAGHPDIVRADSMRVVWRDFQQFISDNIGPDEVGILVAYNGEKCDLKWIWKLTQAPMAPYDMPPKLLYYVDPYVAITKYKTCTINKEKSHLESLELGVIWKYLDPQNRNLNGAHNSLVDAKAQTDIIIHEKFSPFINRKNSIQTIGYIFSKSDQNDMKKKMEHKRPIHAPWTEQTKNSNIQWEPIEADRYTGSDGGPPPGPSRKIVDVVSKAESLANIFLAMIPLSFWSKVAELTAKYCYEDWVVEKEVIDSFGNKKKKIKSVLCMLCCFCCAVGFQSICW